MDTQMPRADELRTVTCGNCGQSQGTPPFTCLACRQTSVLLIDLLRVLEDDGWA